MGGKMIFFLNILLFIYILYSILMTIPYSVWLIEYAEFKPNNMKFNWVKVALYSVLCGPLCMIAGICFAIGYCIKRINERIKFNGRMPDYKPKKEWEK